MPRNYQAFGLNILSELVLPELLPGDPDKEIDLFIQYGDISEQLEGAVILDPWSQVKDSCLQLNIEETARYQAISGNRIIIQPHPQAAATSVRLYLLGTILGAILHQRKSIPLHASAVVVNGGIVAFTGDSGAGKSTIAAYLYRRGYKIISDDLIALVPCLTGKVMVYGGYPRIKLWGDTVDELAINKKNLTPDHFRMDKYHIAIQDAYHAEPVLLDSVYLLDTSTNQLSTEINQLKGIQAIKILLENTYRPHFVTSLNDSKHHFHVCSNIVQTANIYRTTRPWGKQYIESWLDELEKNWNA